MLFIPCFLSYLILHFRTYHCLGSKETTTWTTYAYSYCSVLCRESCRPCHWAVRLRGGVGPGCHEKYCADTNLYDFIDLYSVSVIAVKCAISCYMGLRYNTTLVISFMNAMPVLWHVPVCVCVNMTTLCTAGDWRVIAATDFSTLSARLKWDFNLIEAGWYMRQLN